jgi:hypothetical protein
MLGATGRREMEMSSAGGGGASSFTLHPDATSKANASANITIIKAFFIPYTPSLKIELLRFSSKFYHFFCKIGPRGAIY